MLGRSFSIVAFRYTASQTSLDNSIVTQVQRERDIHMLLTRRCALAGVFHFEEYGRAVRRVLSNKYGEKEGLECLGEDVSTRRIGGRSKDTFDNSIV